MIAITENQLIPETIDIRQNGDRLLLTADGEELHIDHIVRCFPFSTPDQWISLRDRDGTELGLLPTLDGLNTQSRARVEEHLKNRYDIPQIQTILNIESNKEGGTNWDIDTNAGPMSFTIRGDQNLNLNAFPEIVFTDAITRKRYKIPDYTKLDRASQKIARAYLPMSSRHYSGRRGGRSRR